MKTTSSALTAAAKSVAGFEDSSVWLAKPGAGTLSLSTDRVQGQSSLSVSGVDTTAEISSAPSAAPSPVDSTIALHIKPPSGQAQQPWKGFVALFVNSPSRHLSASWVGTTKLDGLVEGKFRAVTFDVPANIRSALGSGTVDDVQYTIKLYVPLPGPYLLDALELQPIAPKAYLGGNDLALVWDVAATPLADTYQVLRDGQVITAGAEAPNSGIPNTFIDKNVVEGQTYSYQVKALYGQGTRTSAALSVTHSSQGAQVPKVSINALAIYSRVSAPAKTLQQQSEIVAGFMAGKKFLETWYPKIANIIAYPAHLPAPNITITGVSETLEGVKNRGCLINPADEKANGVAGWYAGGTTLKICEANARDMGLYVHESTHIIQMKYQSPVLPGLPESTASWAGNLALGQQHRRPTEFMTFYDDYEYGAYFYDFVAETVDPDFVRRLNQAAFLGQFDDNWLASNLQRTLGQLWGDMAGSGFSSPGALRNRTGQFVYPKDKGDESDSTPFGLRIRHNPPGSPARFFQGQTVNGKGLLRWEKDYCFGESQSVIVLQTCDAAADRWSYEDGAFVNAKTGRCMQAFGGSTADMTPIGTASCDGSAAQQWDPLPL